MKTKKLISLLLAVVLVVSSFAVCATSVAAAENYNEYEKMLEDIKPENNYGLADTVNEGKIIQAWNWSYANIIANLETLAEQGFTTIQVSPPNELKMPTKGVKVCEPAIDGIAPNGWWMFYQPAGFQLNESTDNALGVKSEFVEMIDKAHELGLKVIVDAVINHMGTDDDHVGVYTNTSTDPMDHVNPRAAQFEPELLAAKAFHSPWVDMTYKENYWDGWSDYDIEEDLTQHCTSGLPDLATETKLVQDTIYEYFVELVEAGADGFRFDAAKHIETEHDTYFASDFWKNTLLKLRENYPQKECYAYGEILNKCGDGRPFSEYTELMDVTDSSSYWAIKDAVQKNGNGGSPTPYYQSEQFDGCDPKTVNFTKENVIQWNESHDTYIDGGTSSLTVQQRNKIWALTAARQLITGVYFARPDDRTGANRAAIEAICANITLGDAAKTSWTAPEVRAVNQFDNYFGDAFEHNSTYDKVTMIERGGLGATLVNLNGTTKSVNMPSNRLAPGTYIDSITGNEFEVTGDDDAGYKITGSIGSTGIACIYYAEDTKPVIPDVPDDPKLIDVSSGNYPVIEGYNTVVYSAKSDWTQAYVYAWMKGTENCITAWPGESMKFALVNDYGERQYVAYIPVEYDCYIINNGQGQQTIDLEVTESLGMYMASQNAAGKWTIGTWSPNFYPYEFPKDDPTEPTDPTDPTDPIKPTVPDDGKVGDADGNGDVNVLDATTIQKFVASIFTEDQINLKLADANADGEVNVLDATVIQKRLAGIEI
ncbi:MAG: starch-binding protein [Ruminococcus sp.]|nr:starch-binding protein [Ruminococcus sp.]